MANPTPLALDKRLTTIGICVKINNEALLGATDFGDLGADPNMLDATTLLDTVRVQQLGLQEYDSWKVNYIFNAGTGSDYEKLKTLQAAGTAVPVSVDLGANGVFSNTATISTYITGAAVGELQSAVCVCALGGEWTWTAAA